MSSQWMSEGESLIEIGSTDLKTVAVMRQCMSCNLVLESQQTYLEHIKPGPLRQCVHCAQVFETQCEFELHQLVSHDGQASSTTMTSEEPAIVANARERGEEELRYLPVHQYTRLFTTEKTGANEPDLSEEAPAELTLKNKFADRCALASSEGKGKLRQLAISGLPQGDLLDLSPNSDEPCNLDKAINDFQVALKQRTMRREPAEESMAIPSQAVELKKRVPVPAPAPVTTTMASTGSAVSALDTPGTSEQANNTPLQIPPPLAARPETQQARTVPTGGIICFECEASFSNILGLHQHQMSNKHNYCDLCYSFFVDRTVLQKHKGQAHNFRCATCNLVHMTMNDMFSHQQLKGHCYCKPCNSYFRDMASHKQHMTVMHDNSRHESAAGPVASAATSASAMKYKCTVPGCKFSAGDPDRLRNHQQRENHNFCRPCNKTFCDAGALSNHRKSGGRHTENVKKANPQAGA